MNSQLNQLAARIRAELTEIERLLQRLEEGWRRYQHYYSKWRQKRLVCGQP